MAIKLTDAKKQQLIDAAKKYGADKVQAQLKSAGYSYDTKTNSLVSNTAQQVQQPIEQKQPIEPIQQPKQTVTPNVTDTQKKMLVDSARTYGVDATVNKLKDAGVTYNQDTGLKIPKPKVTAPIKTETPTEQVKQPTDFTKIQSVEDWKTQTGGGIQNLENWIEARYGTVANVEGNKVTANIGGVNYQWQLDEAGNPIKTQVPLNADEIYKQMQTGMNVYDDGTVEYGRAQARFDIANKYVGMTEDQLYNAYVNGEISSDLEKDLVNNPYLELVKQKYNNYLQTKNINNEMSSILSVYNGTRTATKTEPTYLQKLSDKIIESFNRSGGDIVSFQNYMAENYGDLVNDTKELNNKNEQIQRLVDERDARLEEIIKENPGISINRATMLAARQNKDINEQIKSMSYEIANLQANINYQTNMAEKEYNYMLANQDRRDRLEAEQRGFAMDLYKTEADREYQNQLLQDQRLYEQSMMQDQRAYEQSMMQDQRLYEQAMLQDQRAYEQANKGVSTSIIQVGDKQQLINTETGELIKEYDMPTQVEKATQDWAKLDDDTLYNQRTGEYRDINTGETTNLLSSDTQSIINYSTTRRGRTNLQCGELVNDYWTQVTGSRAGMGDTIESKVDALTKIGVSNIPVAGGLFVSNPGNNDTGHTGIVQSVNADGSITTLEANIKGLKEGQAPTIRTYTADEVAGMVFSQAPNQKEEAITNFKQDSIPQYENYLKTGKIGTNSEELKAITKEFGSIENFKKQAELYNNSENGPRQRELDKIEKLRNQVSSIIDPKNAETLSNSVGTTQWTIGLTPQRRRKEAYLADIQNFLDGKTLQQLIDVKAEGATFGALSNEELKMLQNSASPLNQLAIRDTETNQITGFKGSEANFKKKVQDMIDVYDEIIKKKKAIMGKTTGNVSEFDSYYGDDTNSLFDKYY